MTNQDSDQDQFAGEMEILDQAEQAANELDNEVRKEIVLSSFDKIVQSTITETQFIILSGRTPKSVIKKRPGKGGRTFSYVPHGYVTAVLNRAFGFDWDLEVLPQENGQMYLYLPPIYGPDKDNNEVLYRPGSFIVHVALTVRIRNPKQPESVIATIRKTATGEKEEIRGMTWGGHIKSAESDGFKKAASRLGVALDLYWQDADEDYILPSPEQIEQKKKQAELKLKILELSERKMTPPEIAKQLKISPKDVVLVIREGE